MDFTKDHMLLVLSRHIGEGNGVHIEQLAREVAIVAWDPTATFQRPVVVPRRIRALIEELRREGHHVCAHPSTGYYMAANDVELNGTLMFLYERAMTTLAQIAAMKRVSLPDLRGQLHLPT